ncbi:hypothetical protein DQQ10_15375 [Pseudochryseolinea flava]|uniref:Toxin-antitoxin system YwqK family antitoxin n=2 Tax=Pseudochryseolinea flava TaxID=2059302 RepID=A0A364Y2U8_9BACT|nr:hypothetical protein DQQ10_15375 [Pseudochryseolinea flava]
MTSRFYTSIGLSWLLVFVAVLTASACQCWTNRKVSVEDLWLNDIIFKGTIKSVKSVSVNGRLLSQALFHIEQKFHSKIDYDTVSVYTPVQAEQCGLTFKVNSVWLMFASGTMYLESTRCSKSMEQRGVESDKQIAASINFFDILTHGDHRIRETIQGLDGSYDAVGEIINGKPHGKWFRVVDGDTLSWFNFYHGKQVGHQLDRSWNGRIEERSISYVNGDKIESVKFYSTHSTDILIARYRNGVLHGPYESRFSDTYKIGEFVNGKEEGEWLVYIDGVLVSSKLYVNGREQMPRGDVN